jgi:uncharacterized iron-regulated membrane protein
MNRRLHRWGAVAVSLPFLLVLATGLLLQVKKQVPWVQPPEQRTEAPAPVVSWERILEVARSIPEAGIEGWHDIDRVDMRPGKGMAKVLSNSRWELQLDIETGEVLQSSYRRTDVIEDLHTGAWFSDATKLWFFFPAALIVTGLWGTGIYMALVHYRATTRRRREMRREHATA